MRFWGEWRPGTLNGALSTPSYLLALLGTFACPAGPYRKCWGAAGTKNEPNRYFVSDRKKGSENRSSRFEPKIFLIFFSRGSGPPLNLNTRNNDPPMYPCFLTCRTMTFSAVYKNPHIGMTFLCIMSMVTVRVCLLCLQITIVTPLHLFMRSMHDRDTSWPESASQLNWAASTWRVFQ